MNTQATIIPFRPAPEPHGDPGQPSGGPPFIRIQVEIPLEFVPGGLEAFAALLSAAATRPAPAVSHQAEELLTLEQAGEISGYSAEYLGRLIREAQVPNAGTRNRPRIRRGDVPIKGGIRPRRVAAARAQGNNSGGLLRDIVTSKFGS